jgi:L,D-transpeptidase ErfK/SrfK
MHTLLRALVVIIAVSTAGCSLFEYPDWARHKADDGASARAPAELAPIVSDRFEIGPDSDVVGEVQVIRAHYEDTFTDIARAYDLGYDELVDANPGVDPWLPGAGTRIVLPTQFILPDAPREGIVLNIGAKRIFYYPKVAKGEAPVVITHPVGIGREGWGTPIGSTTVVAKVTDPVWTVPASIRKEHADAGDPLPARVAAGPDNPLGAYALRLGFPSYLIHGTNKPSGIGMRVSHGCVQLFPEDIESLFSQVPVGTRVQIVNQPQLLGWDAGNLYLEVHPALEDDQRNLKSELDTRLDKQLKRRPAVDPGAVSAAVAGTGAKSQMNIDRVLIASTVSEGRGFPVRLLEPAADAPSVVARARPAVNVVAHPVEAGAATDTAPDVPLDAANR